MKRILSLVLLLFGATAAAPAGDWSFWRGPEQTGVSRERDLPDTFSLTGGSDSNLLWRSPYGGIGAPVVQKGRVYFMTKTGSPGEKDGTGIHQQERVVCFDADDGKLLWQHKFNVFYTDIVRSRLGWGQCTGDPETGNVYAHGTQGFFYCFDKDGKVLWEHSLTEEYGRVSGYGGRVTSPTVDGDLVILGIVNGSWGEQSIGCTRFVAFNKHNGKVVWWGTTNQRVKDTYYSTPVVAVIGGERLLISGGGDGGVHAFKVRTGEKVWSYLFGIGMINTAPVVHGDLVYIGNGEGNLPPFKEPQGRVICLNGAKVQDGQPELVWQVDGIKAKFASPILHEGRLYIPNDFGKLYCLDAKTGDEIWSFKYGRNTKASPVWADGKIYVSEVDSKFHILKPGPDGCKKLCSVFFRATGGGPVELAGSPAVANGRVYFPTSSEMICIGKRNAKGESDPIPPEPREKPVASDAKPALLQVFPADITLTPGQSAAFKVRAFDDRGHLLGEVKADWSLAGVRPPVFPIGLPAPPPPKTPPPPPPPLAGGLSAKTGKEVKLTAAKAPNGQFGRVVARVGKLTGEARVRVAPVPPIVQDFSKVPVGRTPAGWVNAPGKFAVKKLPDGTPVLAKRNDNPNPLISEAYTFISLPTLTNYTIEADVRSSKVGENLGDIGIGANRYTLQLMGNYQTVRIISWEVDPPRGRINESVDWKWKPDVWYRMKLTAQVAKGKAVVRGKVWPRDEKEPEKWTVEVEDPTPNPEGSPTLYGKSIGVESEKVPGTEIYYANVKVTRNK